MFDNGVLADDDLADLFSEIAKRISQLLGGAHVVCLTGGLDL